MASYDILGSVVVCKFGGGASRAGKMKLVKELLKRPGVKTVVEKVERVKGRLRVFKVRHLGGEKSLEALYKENGCKFRLNIEKCYFSSRLSNERKEIASKVRKGDRVLVMFGGVAPFGIVIAKLRGVDVVSVELGRECCKYARENVVLNKVVDKVKIIQGDVKKRVSKDLGKFDVIVMPRPNLRESFLDCALKAAKKGTRIFYYCFGREQEIEEELNEIKKEFGKKIKILRRVKAGEIAPYKWRWRVEIKNL